MKWRGPFGGGAASGAAGALVASVARTTQYLRARVRGVNPNTPLQQEVRNAVSVLSQRWGQTLTDAQRTAWGVYGTNVATNNTIGDSINLTGQAWYIACNVSRIQAGYGIIDSAPVIFNRGDPLLTGAAFTGNGTSGTFTLGTTTLPVDGFTNSFFALYASRPFGQGRTKPVGGNQLAAIIPGNTTAASHAFTLPFSIAGTLSQMQLTVKLSREDGRYSSGLNFSVN